MKSPSLKSQLKGLLAIMGFRLIDRIEVYFDRPSNTVYPIVSKSGCSSIKLMLIRRYAPGFIAEFPGIHQVNPSLHTDGQVERLIFNTIKAYFRFMVGKHMVLVIREPRARLFSCYIDVVKGKNVMYQDPSGLDAYFKVPDGMSLMDFLYRVAKIPDRLADRHFRSQAFYLPAGLAPKLSSLEIRDMKEFLASDLGETPESKPHLNVNAERLSAALKLELEKSAAFSKRYGADVALYEEIALS